MSAEKEILTNRQAFHEFHILDKYEAGAALVGTEVKSIMAGRIQLKESFVQIKNGEVWLVGAHISHYSHGNINNHDVLRDRKLLLHRREIEKLVKEFDIKVGFHDHPKRDNDPKYRMWDPNYVYSLVKDRDQRIGSCADTGHWVRSGIKPVDAIKALHGRIVSSHLKDLNEFSPGAHDMPYGLGVSDIPAILSMFDKMKMNGSVSVEYEYNWDTNVTEVAQCLGFVRGIYGK